MKISYMSTPETRNRPLLNTYDLFYKPLWIGWRYRDLILGMLSRELKVRFANSVIGRFWAVLSPIVMFLIYISVFKLTFGATNIGTTTNPNAFVLSVFSGMVVFNLFTEILSRSPGLIMEHLPFVKRTIFPSEVIAWVAVLRALVYGGIAFVILLIFTVFVNGTIYWTWLLIPLVVGPMILTLLGITWLFAAIGAFTRDLSHIISVLGPLLMFVTPVFYDLKTIPQPLQMLLYLNPMTIFVELMRSVVVLGEVPELTILALAIFGALAMFAFGYQIFIRYKSVLVDVI